MPRKGSINGTYRVVVCLLGVLSLSGCIALVTAGKIQESIECAQECPACPEYVAGEKSIECAWRSRNCAGTGCPDWYWVSERSDREWTSFDTRSCYTIAESAGQGEWIRNAFVSCMTGRGYKFTSNPPPWVKSARPSE